MGLWSGLSSNVTVEVLANSGFGWLRLDAEHSPNQLPMVHSQRQAIAAGRAHPIVRPPWNDTVTIKRYLDLGVRTLLIPFIQDAQEAVPAVDGVDAIFIGPGDLAASMGLIGKPTRPEVVAAIEDAVRRIRACGKPAGTLVGDETLTRHYIDIGCAFVAVGSDIGILARGAEALAAKFK